MVGLRFLLAGAAWPLLGWGFLRSASREEMDRVGQIGLAGVCGAVLLGVEMFVASVIGVRWSVPLLAAPLLPWSLGCLLALRSRRRTPPRARIADALPGALAALFAFGLLVFSTATARATSSDLLLFWGSKGIHFAMARGIDVGFLRAPVNYLGHTDYPPLLPELYAFATIAAGRFAWGAALLYTPLVLFFAAAAVWGLARPALGPRRAALTTALLVALVGYGIGISTAAGNADALVLSCTIVACASLVYAGDRMHAVAALALAGAVLAKVEGAAIAAFLVGAFSVGRGFWRRAWRLGGPAAAAAAAWVAFGARHGLLDTYRSAVSRLLVENIPGIAANLWREAAFSALYVPWLVLFAIAAARGIRAIAWRPLAAGAAFGVFILWMYAHNVADPRLFVAWSGKRLLMIPLVFLFFAVVAVSPEGRRAATAADG